MDDTTGDFEKICQLLVEQLANYDIRIEVSELSKRIEEADISYEEGFDRICVVVDRDKYSFTKEQYHSVLEICKREKFGFYLSNPCFEFWLLLHYEDVLTLDISELKENKIISGKKRYAEHELCKKLKGYKKGNRKVEEVISQTDIAIENEKKFCQDIEKLEEEVGSNIGILITTMRKKEKGEDR